MRQLVLVHGISQEHKNAVVLKAEWLDALRGNKTDVHNRTSNRHGIAGYLDDLAIASRIYDALTT
jgi:hypothetical protein